MESLLRKRQIHMRGAPLEIQEQEGNRRLNTCSEEKAQRDREATPYRGLHLVVAPTTALDMCVSPAAAVGSSFGGEALLSRSTQQCSK